MKQYCKAYHLGELRRFTDWTDIETDGQAPLPDTEIVYIWDDLTVVTNPVAEDSGLLWDSLSANWERFCRDELKFEIPEDLTDG
jgi:hypothetical protein